MELFKPDTSLYKTAVEFLNRVTWNESTFKFGTSQKKRVRLRPANFRLTVEQFTFP